MTQASRDLQNIDFVATAEAVERRACGHAHLAAAAARLRRQLQENAIAAAVAVRSNLRLKLEGVPGIGYGLDF